MIEHPESLKGRRFTCDLRVEDVTPQTVDDPTGGERVVTFFLYGERAQLSLAEFSALVETGILVEVPER
jgi:hypothetical protein